MLKQTTFKTTLTALAVGVVLAAPVQAKVSEADAARLGNDLTPMGAVAAGNESGTIPPWQGLTQDQIPAAHVVGKHPQDLYPNEKPLFEITAQNVEQYKDKLTLGQQALFAAYPDTFKMPVYTSHRNAIVPGHINANTKAAAAQAELLPSGQGFTGAYAATPFPQPANGLEAIWNHIVRYRGEFMNFRASEVAVQRNGAYSLATDEVGVSFNYYDPKGSEATLNNVLFYYMGFAKAPARSAGGAVLVHEYIDQVAQPRQAWGYSPGQRRVRRAPSLAYDTPIGDADGLRTVDDTDMFSGAPDRYDWKLLGKKEIYIPYNNYRLVDPSLKYADLLKPGHIDPSATRYELHRVWEVEATLKDGERHVYSKRRFYLDEDSWGIAVADQYDGRGELWRVSLAYLMNYYDAPTTWTGLDVYHDLQARRYHARGLLNEEKSFVDFSQPMPDAKYFKPANLRRKAQR